MMTGPSLGIASIRASSLTMSPWEVFTKKAPGFIRTIIGIDEAGRISLSIKRAQEQERPQRPAAAKPSVPKAPLTFEEKLKQFMSVSDSKQSELNRYIAGKRGGSRRRK